MTADECNLSSYPHVSCFVKREKLVRAFLDMLYVVNVMNNKCDLNKNAGSKPNTHKLIFEACRELKGNIFKDHSSIGEFVRYPQN